MSVLHRRVALASGQMVSGLRPRSLARFERSGEAAVGLEAVDSETVAASTHPAARGPEQRPASNDRWPEPASDVRSGKTDAPTTAVRSDAPTGPAFASRTGPGSGSVARTSTRLSGAERGVHGLSPVDPRLAGAPRPLTEPALTARSALTAPASEPTGDDHTEQLRQAPEVQASPRPEPRLAFVSSEHPAANIESALRTNPVVGPQPAPSQPAQQPDIVVRIGRIDVHNEPASGSVQDKPRSLRQSEDDRGSALNDYLQASAGRR